MDKKSFHVDNKNIEKSISDLKAYQFLVRTREVKLWIEEMINETIQGDTSELVLNLRDGVVLCNLSNVFAKGIIKKIHSVKSGSVLAFMATDNINSFFKAIDSVKFNKIYVFGVVDLWEMKNIRNVIGCLHALARYVGTLGDYVKIKNLSKTKQEFNEKEISETKKILEEIEKDDPKKETTLYGLKRKKKKYLFKKMKKPILQTQKNVQLMESNQNMVLLEKKANF